MSNVFSPFSLRGLTLKNRVVMSPMLMYAAGDDGLLNDKLFVHYGARALGGVGMIVTEVLGVESRGRISPKDLGIWTDAQAEGLSRLVDFVHACGAKIAAQLAHAGRKSHLTATAVAPSAIPYDNELGAPRAVAANEIEGIVEAYAAAARRAVAAGFDAVEVHAANGYLLHNFLAPIANDRTDAYGGDFKGRSRLPLEVAQAVRAAIPPSMPLLYRMVATDLLAGGVTEEESTALAGRLKAAGVDLIDVTTGNILPGYPGPVYPGYQVPYAEALRKTISIATATTGSVASLDLMEEIIGAGRVDLVFLGRALLRDPFWTIAASEQAGVALDLPMPTYARASGPFERGF